MSEVSVYISASWQVAWVHGFEVWDGNWTSWVCWCVYSLQCIRNLGRFDKKCGRGSSTCISEREVSPLFLWLYNFSTPVSRLPHPMPKTVWWLWPSFLMQWCHNQVTVTWFTPPFCIANIVTFVVNHSLQKVVKDWYLSYSFLRFFNIIRSCDHCNELNIE